MSSLDLDALRAALIDAFQAADQEGSGQLSEAAALQALASLGATQDLRLNEHHKRAMFAAMDVDESGTVSWWVCRALLTSRHF